ncbi:hypothetical protein Plhal304r1_c014g0051241 [Plasmopara halstedii]
MVKHSILALLFMFFAVLYCAQAQEETSNNVEQLPVGAILVGDEEPIPGTNKEHFVGGRGRFFRHRFRFPYAGGFRFGWRYPLGYWNTIGRPIYGPTCLFGRPFGGFFFC